MSDRILQTITEALRREDPFEWTLEERAAAVVAALKSQRIQLTQLPEPDGKPYQAGWMSALGLAKFQAPEFGPVSVWDDGSILFDADVLTADKARGIAAVLLAAAEAAEEEK